MNPMLQKLQGLLGPQCRPDEGADGADLHRHDPGDDGAAAAAVPLDLLFTFNIAISADGADGGGHMLRPLDFAAFPTVLLSPRCCACR
jgi:flagellar biosynthesis protein FlhA